MDDLADGGFDLGSRVDLGGRDSRRGDDGTYSSDPRRLKAPEFFSLELPLLTPFLRRRRSCRRNRLKAVQIAWISRRNRVELVGR